MKLSQCRFTKYCIYPILRIEPHHEKAFLVGTGHLHVVTMQLIRVRTRILITEVIESIPGKKLGFKIEKLDFDPENLAVLTEI